MKTIDSLNTLSGMAVFAAVVEAGGFSPAARRLGLSKSVISKQITRLENHLGTRLLNRTTRKLSLTEAGTLYYDYAARVLEQARAAEDAITDVHRNPQGTLRVTVPMSFGLQHVAPEIATFMTRYPNLRVDITMEDRITDLVESGIDVAIRIGNLPDSTAVARRLTSTRVFACAAPAYLAAHGTPQQPEDLLQHQCLIYSQAYYGQEWVFANANDSTKVKVPSRLSINSGLALREAAVAGLGIVRLPAFTVAEDLRAGRLQRVLPDHSLAELNIYAVFPPGRHVSTKSRLFVEFLTEVWGSPPAWEQGV